MTDYSPQVESSEEIEGSIEIPNSGGARKSKLVTAGDTIQFMYEDTKTLWDVIQRGLRQSDNGPCLGWRHLESDYSWITYSQFIKKAESFGSGLINVGLKPGQSSKVGIYAQNSVEWVVTQYGCASQSIVLVPLYDTMGLESCTFIINQADIEYVICDEEIKVQRLVSRAKEIPKLESIIYVNSVSHESKNLATEAKINLYLFSNIEKLGESHPVQKLLPRPSDICSICYTSGTSGKPKGAMVTHGNLVSAASVMPLMMGKSSLTKDDRMISYLPLPHMFEQKVQNMSFLEGCSIGFFRGDVSLLEEDMRALQPTFFPAVPRLLHKLREKAKIAYRKNLKTDLQDINFESEGELIKAQRAFAPFKNDLGGKVRMVISAAAPLNQDVFEFFSKCLGYEILEIYGATEMAGGVFATTPSFDFKGNVGSPSPCCNVKLVDVPELGYFSKDLKGEVCLKGPNKFIGYFKNPEKTAEVVDDDGWYHSEDIGMWLPNGTLKLIGRKNNIMKLSQGEYVALEKIESVYLASPYISQILVYGDSSKELKTSCMETRDPTGTTLEIPRRYIGNNYARYVVEDATVLSMAVVIPFKEYVLQQFEESIENDDWDNACKTSLKQLIFEDMRRLGKSAGLNSFEQVKGIHLHSEAMTHEAGFMTATQKKKREVWRNYFAKEIDALYDDSKES